jgi:8-oxo-dGTP diphosphatase
MAFEDVFRLSAHAVITDNEGKILQLKSTYEGERWGIPGGALDPGETIHEALIRECLEELGININVLYMSGMYYHKAYNAQACLFRCEIPENSKIVLSSEHSEFRYFAVDELSTIQKIRITDCLEFNGKVKSQKF